MKAYSTSCVRLRQLHNQYSEYNLVISNNQKIILKRSHKEKGAGEKLFAAEKKYTPAAKDLFGGLDDGAENIDTEEDLIANARFEMLKRLRNLGNWLCS